MKLHPAILTALCAAALAATAYGQHTPPSPAQMAEHEVQRYTALLTLTAEQQAQATTIFTTEATTTQSLFANEKTLHTTLKTAINSNDTASINQTAASLGQLDGERVAARSIAQASLYQILTAAQREQLAAEESAHVHGGGPGGGPGDGWGGR